jgi:hypothetical protein
VPLGDLMFVHIRRSKGILISCKLPSVSTLFPFETTSPLSDIKLVLPEFWTMLFDVLAFANNNKNETDNRINVFILRMIF